MQKQDTEIFTHENEVELFELSLKLLSRFVSQTDLEETANEVTQLIASLKMKPDSVQFEEFEAKIMKLSFLVSIPQLGFIYLRQNMEKPVIDFSQQLLQIPEFPRKNELSLFIGTFLERISILATIDQTADIYSQK